MPCIPFATSQMVIEVAAMLVAPACMQNPVLGLERKPPGLQAHAGAAEPVHKRHVERNVWWCRLLDGAWKGACHPAIGSVFLSVKRDHGQATARGKQTSQGQNTDKLLTLNANDAVGRACRLFFEQDETDQSKHDYLPLNKQHQVAVQTATARVSFLLHGMILVEQVPTNQWRSLAAAVTRTGGTAVCCREAYAFCPSE